MNNNLANILFNNNSRHTDNIYSSSDQYIYIQYGVAPVYLFLYLHQILTPYDRVLLSLANDLLWPN